jgi:hypothetical protein
MKRVCPIVNIFSSPDHQLAYTRRGAIATKVRALNSEVKHTSCKILRGRVCFSSRCCFAYFTPRATVSATLPSAHMRLEEAKSFQSRLLHSFSTCWILFTRRITWNLNVLRLINYSTYILQYSGEPALIRDGQPSRPRDGG